jgi:hypothetical protein
MRHPRGRVDYELRVRIVEPVSEELKTCQKLTTVFRRGPAHAQTAPARGEHCNLSAEIEY